MTLIFPRCALGALILVSGLSLGLVGCKKLKGGHTPITEVPVIVALELGSNGLKSLPGVVYGSQNNSPIHWQPWTRETLQRAKSANRLVLAVIAMPQQPGFQSVIKSLASDPVLVSEINEKYVPVLVDGDAAREIGLLTADLCAEIKQGIQLPLFVWMTPDANPVAWIPVSPVSAQRVSEIFNKSHTMISRMWREDPSYVVSNSNLDNNYRRIRFADRRNSKVMSEHPGADAILSVRQLVSRYDSMSRSFDESGGLFPAGSLELFAASAMLPSLPEELRLRCRETTANLLGDLLGSAMFDPLDGGVFTARRGNAWELPSFSRDCVSQARVTVALLNAYRATGNVKSLDKALGLISFAEKSYATTEGLFSLGLAADVDINNWLWKIEEIERLLPPDDAAWWIKATAMKGLGNLPSEADPHREFFRCNSLGITQSVAELAAEQSLSVEAFTPRYDSVRKILIKERSNRIVSGIRDNCSHAGATFRMVSAYSAAFAATGEEQFRVKAIDLLVKARGAFSDGPQLRLFSQAAPASIGGGRAFLYGLALQAALDVSAITTDDQWLGWSEDLAATAAELFVNGDFLNECPKDAKILDLPITDLVMLFDDSTAGLISFAECRLAERERPLDRTFSQLATPLPRFAIDRPILYTDLLQATLAREFKLTVITGSDLPPDMKLAIERLPLRMIQRRPAKSADDVPAGSVKVVIGDEKAQLVSSTSALQQAVLPASSEP